MQHSDHGEVSRILRQKLLLLVNCYEKSGSSPQVPSLAMGNVPGSPTVESLVEPFEALALVLFDILFEDTIFVWHDRYLDVWKKDAG